MHINDVLTVKIEKLSNLGTGIARVDNFVIFVNDACPEDIAKIRITKLSKSFANADILEIISPSKYRVKPFCPMQSVCGACQLQFIDYDYQLTLKQQIVQDALQSIAGLDIEVMPTVASPQNKEYRHKIQYPIAQTKNSGRILAGYFKPQTHEIVNIKYCPIQPQVCDEIIDFVRQNAPRFNISGYNEKKHNGDLRHVVLRVSASFDEILVTLVVNATKPFKNIENFANEIFKHFNQVVGVCVNLNSKKTNVILSDKTLPVIGKDFINEKFLDKIFKIGANTFFQVNPKSAENIFSYVKNEVKKSAPSTLLDAYAGIATFGIVVSDVVGKVTSVEANQDSIKKAQEVLSLNNINNVELFAEDTTKYLKSIKKKFDMTILDPPRKGCSQESLEETLAHTRDKIIYVSCNPATLARDLKFLCANGCKLQSVQPFDMFCHTYHVETVAVLSLK